MSERERERERICEFANISKPQATLPGIGVPFLTRSLMSTVSL